MRSADRLTSWHSFNPRTREGATLHRSFVQEGGRSFNPRTREGATPFLFHCPGQVRVSIHAPVRVRRDALGLQQLQPEFQSTHP